MPLNYDQIDKDIERTTIYFDRSCRWKGHSYACLAEDLTLSADVQPLGLDLGRAIVIRVRVALFTETTGQPTLRELIAYNDETFRVVDLIKTDDGLELILTCEAVGR